MRSLPFLCLVCCLSLSQNVANCQSDGPRSDLFDKKSPQNSRQQETRIEYNSIKHIILYTEGFCSECQKVADFFKKNQVKFETRRYVPVVSAGLGRLLTGEKPPVTLIYYSNGTSRRIQGADLKILGNLVEAPISTQGEYDNSGFDVRGEPDSYDISK